MTYAEKAKQVNDETRAALQTVFDELNHGQQQKLIKDKKVKKLFDFYGVTYEE